MSDNNFDYQQPLPKDPDSSDIFTKPLQPSKPWYRRWWLYAYAAVFLVSLFVLVVFNQYTSQTLNRLDLDNLLAGQQLPSGSGFTVLPGATGAVAPGAITTAATLAGAEANPFLGTPEALLVIVGFADFQCPYCRQAFPIIRELVTKYPSEVYYVHRDFPISDLHPQALLAAQAGRCAGEQNYFWQLHDLLYINQDKLDQPQILALARGLPLEPERFAACLQSNKYSAAVGNDYRLGLDLGVTGTPTFFVNGHPLVGVVPLATWEQILGIVRLTAGSQ